MKFRIVKIVKVEAKTQVSLNYGKKIIDFREPVWQEAENSTYPAAAFLIDEHPAQLKVTVQITDAKAGEYTLKSFQKLHGSDPVLIFSGKAEIPEADEVNIVFLVSAKIEPKGFYLISGEKSSWQLTWDKTTIKWESQSIKFELYWLYGFDTNFFKKGVPVEILQQITYACQISGQIHSSSPELNNLENNDPELWARKWVIKAVVNSCFYRNPPRYEIANPQPHYAIGGGEVIDLFLLHPYLDDILNPIAVCNCHDQAILVQVFLKAIGINEVRYCAIYKSFYLRITNLIGRGLCNNPKYGENTGGYPIVDLLNDNRTCFFSHAFCIVKHADGKEWVLDSCVGPHTGDENPYVYLKNVCDDIPKPEVEIEKMEIKYYNGVISIYQINSIRKEPKFKSVEDFKKIVGYSEEIKEKIKEYYVLWSMPDPKICPVMGKDDWEIFYDQIIPGISEAMRILTLMRKGECIDIKIFVSSGGNEFSINRFLSLASMTDSPKLPYEKGPSYLGQLSAKQEIKNRSIHFWVCHNVVFEVRCINLTFNVEKLLILLNVFHLFHREEDFKKYFPLTNDITCSNKKPKVGETVTFQLKTQKDILMDFNLKGEGLRIINKTDTTLKFIALEESENELVLMLVDKNTLLVNNKEFSINVKC